MRIAPPSKWDRRTWGSFMTSPIYVEEHTDSPPPLPDAPPDAAGDADHDRVRRLEEEVFTLRDTMSRFAELVLGELKQMRHSPPAAAAAPGAVSAPDLLPPSSTSERSHRPWLLIELLRDIATTFRMYLDPRYRVRRSTQLLIPVILALFVGNYLFWSAVPFPIVNTILQKLGDIILAILLYKVLSSEMDRYREVLRQYSAWEAERHSGRARVIHSNSEGPHTQMDAEG